MGIPAGNSLGRASAAGLSALTLCIGSCHVARGPVSPPISAAATPTSAYEPAATEDPLARHGILRRSGTEIVDGAGQPVRLRGVAFGNEVWNHHAIPVHHHDETDFERVRAMGMNVIRFYIYSGTLEDDAAPGIYKEAGWQWLDRNVAWARRHGIYLIFNMHVPPGGFQSMGEGRALWEVPANQDRLVGLWRAIAARYAHEPIIAGYDLLNEPGVAKSKIQWQGLANRIVKRIREVDPLHIVIVERVNSIARDWKNDADMNFILVDDPNVVYTFHFYDPFDYTHQLAGWAKMGEGGRYPDDARVAHSSDTKWINVATFDSPKLPSGDTPWTHSEGPRLAATDPRAVIGHISLVGRNVGNGRASFDDLMVEEFDEQGHHIGEAMRLDLSGLGGWYFWTADGTGHAGVRPEGHDSIGALVIGDTTGDANLGSAQHELALKHGHSYSVSGWMKGEGLPASATVQIRLDFLGSDTAVLGRNRAFLASQLDRYLAWGRAHGVPLFLGEFGLYHPCFEASRGGLTWVADLLDLIETAGLHFTYHAYHEDGFGLYRGSGPVDPTRANHELIALFAGRLSGR
jgi:endoglucanase